MRDGSLVSVLRHTGKQLAHFLRCLGLAQKVEKEG